MSKEKDFIRIIDRQMPKSERQLNNLFQTDAEIVDFDGGRLIYNIDEFSEEDFLRENNPYVLGWNLAAGTISDILATGGRPVYYAHSLAVKRSWTADYVEKLAQGIAAVLKEAGASFIGGDLSFSSTWRYTGSVIGEIKTTPLSRNSAKVGDLIYLTGEIGAGNLEAAYKIYSDKLMVKSLARRRSNWFQLRLKEAELIKKYSNCCIDSSDGAFNAVNTLADLSRTGFELDNLPYLKKGILLAKFLKIPKELLFLGECGEYELVFTISPGVQDQFLEKAGEEKLNFYQVGRVQAAGVKILRDIKSGKTIDFNLFNLSARDYLNPREYLQALIAFLQN